MKIIDLNVSELEAQSWSPTCKLRWTLKEIIINEIAVNSEKVLQQMWQGDKGGQEWRDIEFS